MKHTREQKRTELLAAAQAVIEEFLDWEEQTARPKLTEIEEQVLPLRERFGQRLAEVALADQDSKQPVDAPTCPECGAGMRYKGQNGLEAESRIGLLSFDRGHYYCARCQSGLFPLDDQLALWDGHWSEGVARDAVWLAGVAPSYEAAEAILQRIGRTNISATSIWRRVQVWGAQFQAVEERARVQATATPELWTPPSRAIVSDQRMGVALDGAMMYILQEGWKEVKVGTVFEVAVGPTQDERTDEVVDLAHAVHNSYVAHLGGPEVLGELVWSEARRRGWEQAQDTEVLGDGAPWVWNQAALHFPDSHQLVDWYHGKQHLTVAGQALKEPASLAYQRWLNSRETLLYQGQAARIAAELAQAAGPPAAAPAGATLPRDPATATPAAAPAGATLPRDPATAAPAHAPTAATLPRDPATATPAATPAPTRGDVLRREAGYFDHNQHRMNYLEMREEEWPIGSGMVESAAKQYKARVCGPGMRWSRAGAEKLLPVRSAILSRRFDDVWAQAYNAPQN